MQDLGLALGNISESYSARTLDEVLSQKPVSGTWVQVGSAVSLEFSIGPRMAKVPQLERLTKQDAESAIAAAELSLGTVEEEFSPTVLSGVVTSQSPMAGSSQPIGTQVDLRVSKGPEMVRVPSLVGFNRTDAELALSTAKLSLGSVTETHSDNPINEVLSQYPDVGGIVVAGTMIDIEVSLGKKLVTVPKLVGLMQADAEAEIVRYELSLGTVDFLYTHAPAGEVLAQIPIAGSSTEETSPIDLRVSKGPEYVAVPPLTGKTEAEAMTIITQAGLFAIISYKANNTIPQGEVISQDPAISTQVVKGSNLNLVISSGTPPGYVGEDNINNPEPTAGSL